MLPPVQSGMFSPKSNRVTLMPLITRIHPDLAEPIQLPARPRYFREGRQHPRSMIAARPNIGGGMSLPPGVTRPASPSSILVPATLGWGWNAKAVPRTIVRPLFI